MNIQQVDYLVVGSGIAGLTAARELSHHGQTTLVSKGEFGSGATMVAQGGIAAAMRKDDSPTFHYADTIRAGAGLCDPEAVRILVEEGPTRVRELIQLGATFDRVDGELDFTREAAHGHRRILHVGDATGREIGKTLGNVLVSEGRVELNSQATVVELIVENGDCLGAWVLQDGDFRVILAKAVVLATGGCGQIFRYNSNPAGATGDGIALAYRAGAVVQDMEFIQFHPTTFSKSGSASFLITEAVRGEGALLRNHAGERFMPRYHVDAELAPRDVVARSIFQEMQKTQTPNMFLDLREMPLDVAKRFPTVHAWCLAEGFELARELIPVAPAAHYMMGGVKTDVWGRTSIKGLYAGGEVSCLGVHGANRLASNSLLDGLVYGYRIAQDIAALSSPGSLSFPRRRESSFGETPRSWIPAFHLRQGFGEQAAGMTDGEDGDIRVALQDAMWQFAGILRSGAGLEKLLGLFSEWREVEMSFEVRNMCCVAELMARAALARTESRGSHYREDFPARDDGRWQRHQEFCQK